MAFWAYPGQLNNTARSVTEQQVPIAAESTPIPFIYGRRLTGGRLLWAGTYSSQLLLHVAWGVGPIEAVESVHIGGEIDPSGIAVNHYVGTTAQGVDPWLADAIPGFANNMVISFRGQSVGIAHSVLRFYGAPTAILPSAVIQGLKVFDPRDASQSVSNPATWKYSTNPSLCLANFITSSVYGKNAKVDWDSVAAAANANDALVGAGKRRTFGNVYDKRAMADQIVSDLAAYAGVFLASRGDTIYFVPDRPAAATRALTASDIRDFKVSESRLSKTPTVVTVRYSEEDANGKWREATTSAKAAGVDTGATEWREISVDRPGINSHAQAYREAVELLNKARMLTIEGSFINRDEGLLDEVGDVVQITHPRGLTNQLVRLMAIQQIETGRWLHRFQIYNSAVYSDVIQSGPSRVSTTLPNPANVPSITGLAASSGTDQLIKMGDGTVAATMLITWDAVSTLFDFIYYVQYQKTGSVHWTQMTIADNAIRTGVVEDGAQYTFRVRVKHIAGFYSPWTTSTHTVIGKTALPGNVTGAALSGKSLTWTGIADLDVWGYKVRYQQGTSTTWATATPAHGGILTTESFDVSGIAQTGTKVTFLIKSVDTTRHESAVAASVSVDLRPPSVTGLAIDGKKIYWARLTQPYIKAYEVRYNQGAVADWDTAEVLAVGFSAKASGSIRTVAQTGTQVTFSVRAIDSAGNTSAASTTITKDIRPGAVPWAFLEKNTITFGQVSEPWVVGYVAKVSLGGTESTAVPMHLGVKQSPIGISNPVGRRHYFIYAQDTAGNLSAIAAKVFADFGTPTANGVLALEYSHAENGWPATSVWGVFSVAGVPATSELDGTVNRLEYTSMAFSPTTYAGKNARLIPEITIENTVNPVKPVAYGLDYYVDSAAMWSETDTDAMWDANAVTDMWDATFTNLEARYQPWSGEILMEPYKRVYFRFKAEDPSDAIKLTDIKFKLYNDALVQREDNLAVSSTSGKRISLTQTFNAITGVFVSIQDTGDGAVSCLVLDAKNTIDGPFVVLYNAAGARVIGIVDVKIEGW
jgi:hypothetical protein